MTSYHQRDRQRLANIAGRKEAERTARAIMYEHAMVEFENAFEAVHERRPKLTMGYGRVLGACSKKVTLRELEVMTTNLLARKHELDLGYEPD